jgi:hypothetical protein
MTGEQRDELSRLRMKAASMGFVTVPRAMLARALWDAAVNSTCAAERGIALNPHDASGLREMEAAELARIAELRAIAGIE